MSGIQVSVYHIWPWGKVFRLKWSVTLLRWCKTTGANWYAIRTFDGIFGIYVHCRHWLYSTKMKSRCGSSSQNWDSVYILRTILWFSLGGLNGNERSNYWYGKRRGIHCNSCAFGGKGPLRLWIWQGSKSCKDSLVVRSTRWVVHCRTYNPASLTIWSVEYWFPNHPDWRPL